MYITFSIHTYILYVILIGRKRDRDVVTSTVGCVIETFNMKGDVLEYSRPIKAVYIDRICLRA